MLAERNGGEVVVFTVAREGGDGLDLEAFVQEHLPETELSRDRIHTRRVSGRHPEWAILNELGNKEHAYDLLVMGCTRAPLMRQFLHESVPEKVARLSSHPVIMVKSPAGIRSWIKRWI
jgi:nucleotide-binding universal stress UspA family protein